MEKIRHLSRRNRKMWKWTTVRLRNETYIERHTEKESERELEKYNVARQARKGEGGHRAGRLLDALLVGGWGKGKGRGGGGGRDSYSRAEGPPAIIFKPLQPTLELVEIKHRITGISASVSANTTLQTDRQTGQTGGRKDSQTYRHPLWQTTLLGERRWERRKESGLSCEIMRPVDAILEVLLNPMKHWRWTVDSSLNIMKLSG